ncbi:MAG: phosphotransferase family protein [Gaiellaceae bacterium]
MSSDTAAVHGGRVVLDADARELFRLLSPVGDDSRIKLVDVSAWRVLFVARLAAVVQDGDLLVVRTWAPRTVRRLLVRHGLTARTYVLAPTFAHARRATPIAPSPARAQPSLRSAIGRLSVWLQARAAVGRTFTVVVLATRGAEVGQWISALVEVGNGYPSLVATISWRGRAGGATAVIGKTAGAQRFLKIAFDAARADRLRREHDRLSTVAVAASQATVTTPTPFGVREADGMLFLVEGIVEGRPAAALPPAAIGPLLDDVADWLATWHESTLTLSSGPEAASDLVRLARDLDLDPAYESWLRGLGARLPQVVPRVAVHRDLTMWNVLVASRTRAIGVVDWEDAAPAGAPLSDLFYVTVDAEFAHGRHDRRIAAFDAVFPHARTVVGAACTRAVQRLALDRAVVRCAFHETWLRHATNERVGSSGPGGFERIVLERLAVHPELYPWGQHS